ncbi:MAG TPA: GspE/PulE family protein [Candidatus Rubrimentiphilum sp.]|nr:GspE/PulE family protein [Candidatus Rubrimentiphilum sp.]
MALKDFDGVRAIDIASVPVETDALRKIPRALAFGRDVLSLSSVGNELTVAVPDAASVETLEKIRFATGMHVHALEAPRDAIRQRLKRIYRDLDPVSDRGVIQPPAVAVANDILHAAAMAGASDVHIEPFEDGGRVRQRVDGILHFSRVITPELFAQVVSRVKLLAGMDIADKRQPQDGRYNLEVNGSNFDARISSVPTIAGEKLAIRLLADHVQMPRLEHLNIPAEYYDTIVKACKAPHGFIVAAGPTGSGKTTTLYAALGERDALSENLCSVEDPIEVRMPGIAQVQTNARAGVTFASALRAFLRQDPNVIMVGEMRDQETAAVAASASLSGQLVLTTLHSNDAPSAIERLIELGVARTTISAGLSVVIAQRLVRALCPSCRVETALDSRGASEFNIPEGTAIFKAVGCNECTQTGYRGRTALFEVLLVDDAIREAISREASAVTIRAVARQRGFRPMFAHGLHRVIAGETTLQELRRVLSFQ